MAKNRSFTGGRHSVGTPTLNKNSYYQLIRGIRKEREKRAEIVHKGIEDSVPADRLATGSDLGKETHAEA